MKYKYNRKAPILIYSLLLAYNSNARGINTLLEDCLSRLSMTSNQSASITVLLFFPNYEVPFLKFTEHVGVSIVDNNP